MFVIRVSSVFHPWLNDMRFPFSKLKTEGVWTPLDARGGPTSDHKPARVAGLNAGFVAAANDPGFRRQPFV